MNKNCNQGFFLYELCAIVMVVSIFALVLVSTIVGLSSQWHDHLEQGVAFDRAVQSFSVRGMQKIIGRHKLPKKDLLALVSNVVRSYHGRQQLVQARGMFCPLTKWPGKVTKIDASWKDYRGKKHNVTLFSIV